MKDFKDSTEFLLKDGHSMNYYPGYGYKFYDGEDNCIFTLYWYEQNLSGPSTTEAKILITQLHKYNTDNNFTYNCRLMKNILDLLEDGL